jgi:inosose dehydratase
VGHVKWKTAKTSRRVPKKLPKWTAVLTPGIRFDILMIERYPIQKGGNHMNKSQLSYAIWPWKDKEAALAEITAIGYRRCETTRQTISDYHYDAPRYAEMLARYGVTADSFYFHLPAPGQESELFDVLERELKFVAALGTPRVTLQGVRGRPDTMDDEACSYQLAQVRTFLDYAKSFGLAVNMHPHVGTYFMYPDEIDWLMERVEPSELGFAPDTAHIAAADGDPTAIVRKYASRVGFTHLKDYKLGDSVSYGGWVNSGIPIMEGFHGLGLGVVDFPEIFRILDAAGYDGPLCAELDRAPVSNAESARLSYEYMCSLL